LKPNKPETRTTTITGDANLTKTVRLLLSRRDMDPVTKRVALVALLYIIRAKASPHEGHMDNIKQGNVISEDPMVCYVHGTA